MCVTLLPNMKMYDEAVAKCAVVELKIVSR